MTPKEKKKYDKLCERKLQLETEMKESLSKKTHDTPEISVSAYLIKIRELRTQIDAFK